MTGRKADIVQVVMFAPGPHALLDRRRPLVRPALDAQEHVLELVHAGVRKQKRRVPGRDEGRAGDALVAPGLKELKKRLTNVATIHVKRVHYNYLLGFEMGEWGMGVGYQVPDTG